MECQNHKQTQTSFCVSVKGSIFPTPLNSEGQSLQAQMCTICGHFPPFPGEASQPEGQAGTATSVPPQEFKHGPCSPPDPTQGRLQGLRDPELVLVDAEHTCLAEKG